MLIAKLSPKRYLFSYMFVYFMFEDEMTICARLTDFLLPFNMNFTFTNIADKLIQTHTCTVPFSLPLTCPFAVFVYFIVEHTTKLNDFFIWSVQFYKLLAQRSKYNKYKTCSYRVNCILPSLSYSVAIRCTLSLFSFNCQCLLCLQIVLEIHEIIEIDFCRWQ